jgi:NAD(P)-dependent dehydrogenase (short-subunit alcohol dehydrogenase family)
MQGKVCLVSGATKGLGRAAALGLAKMGATVLIIGRNPQKVEATLSSLREETRDSNADGFLADLSSQSEVRRVANEILARYPRIDVLINNVGATLLQYQSSPDGIEMTWALNYLNHFLMTYLMLGGLKSAASRNGEARIIELTSSIYRMSSVNFDRRQTHRFYNGVLAYSQSKRAVITYVVELARRLSGSGVTINTVTPGFVRTGIAGGNGLPAKMAMWVVSRFSLPVERGVQPILHLATAPELRGISGKYYNQYRQMTDDPTCTAQATIDHLWQMSERMTGLL